MISTVRWPIDREWTRQTHNGDRERITTSRLRDWPACGLLGSAGLGKSAEMAYLADLDRERGLVVLEERLALLGPTADRLQAQLEMLSHHATSETAIYLDALDEVSVPVRHASLIVSDWIRTSLAATRPVLRISCRSAVWSREVEQALRATYGDEFSCVATLQALRDQDIEQVVLLHGVDLETFRTAISNYGLMSLAEQPLTLLMLLRVLAQGGTPPSSRNELFEAAIRTLADERERHQDGTAIPIANDVIIEAAERLACYCLLSGRELVDLSAQPPSTSLGRLELEGLPSSGAPLTFELLLAVGRSGLCSGNAINSYRFFHRHIAEYLAGRRLGQLLPHQSRSLLASSLGWQAGVAGPLRETAAFACGGSTDIAAWVCDCDPEVIGLSDISDESLRRRATLNFIDRFRRQEMTDSQVFTDGLRLAGFRYDGAEADFRQILGERHSTCEDVLEITVEIIESWRLTTMAEDLADLMLDSTAPLQARKAAGYALSRIGSDSARRKVLPLAAGVDEDALYELKGLALRCNWPLGMSSADLLAVLVPPASDSIHGAYDGFLFELERAGFNASDARLAGLLWAKEIVEQCSDHSSAFKIGQRIASAALDDLHEPGIADALADVLLAAAERHQNSPLTEPGDSGGVGGHTATRSLQFDSNERRRLLLESIARKCTSDSVLWSVYRETPGLRRLEDFGWLIEQSCGEHYAASQQLNFAEMASNLPWRYDAVSVDLWLTHADTPPVSTKFPAPTTIELGSEEAHKLRAIYEASLHPARKVPRRRLRPSVRRRIQDALHRSETADLRYFFNLARELTLKPDSTHYRFERFLTRSPGWLAAKDGIRRRIIDIAKRLLLGETDEPEHIRQLPLNSIVTRHLLAIFLLIETDPQWLSALPTDWWQRWAWYILRELRPFLAEELEEPKQQLLHMLHQQANAELRKGVLELATASNLDAGIALRSLLQVLTPLVDAQLDQSLCDSMVSGSVPQDRLKDVAEFLLTRNATIATNTALSVIHASRDQISEQRAISCAVALLNHGDEHGWAAVIDLLRRSPQLRKAVLDEFAHGTRMTSDSRGILRSGTSTDIGALAGIMLDTYPPEDDSRDGDSPFMRSVDMARQLRDQLISGLGDRNDSQSVEALRSLERQYGVRYPWLRRPRARAERAFRNSQWTPVPLRTTAEMLRSQEKRLIRSATDLLDGIVAAIEMYAHRIRHSHPSELIDLWNTPRGVLPTPRDEEYVSDKIRDAVSAYFQKYAVVADREVQIVRRALPERVGGLAGSELDVLCTIPAAGAMISEPLLAPIEVKLSHNREAKSGLNDQLCQRYMNQLGTDIGVFVVTWLGNFHPSTKYRPAWPSLEEAKFFLGQQAKDLVERGIADVRVCVIDASLSVRSNAASTKKSTKKATKKSTKKATKKATKKSTKKATKKAKSPPLEPPQVIRPATTQPKPAARSSKSAKRSLKNTGSAKAQPKPRKKNTATKSRSSTNAKTKAARTSKKE